MRVGDLREFDQGDAVVTVAGDATVLDATKTMAEAKIGAVLVVENEQVAGIFTERDVMNRVVAAQVDATTTTVRDVMTANVQTVKVDDAAIDCLETMADGNFRHLPVVDEDGRPIGMLSQRDFVATTLPRALALTGKAARATVAKRYQPFAIAATVLVYTLVVVVVMNVFG